MADNGQAVHLNLIAQKPNKLPSHIRPGTRAAQNATNKTSDRTLALRDAERLDIDNKAGLIMVPVSVKAVISFPFAVRLSYLSTTG